MGILWSLYFTFIGLAPGTSFFHSLDNVCEDYFSVCQKFSDCDDCGGDAEEDGFEVAFKQKGEETTGSAELL